MHFIVRFGQNYLTKIISNWMPLACFESHLTKNAIYSIVRDISSNLNIALRVKMLKN